MGQPIRIEDLHLQTLHPQAIRAITERTPSRTIRMQLMSGESTSFTRTDRTRSLEDTINHRVQEIRSYEGR